MQVVGGAALIPISEYADDFVVMRYKITCCKSNLATQKTLTIFILLGAGLRQKYFPIDLIFIDQVLISVKLMVCV